MKSKVLLTIRTFQAEVNGSEMENNYGVLSVCQGLHATGAMPLGAPFPSYR